MTLINPMPLPKNATFGQVKNYIDFVDPGKGFGQQFINWVNANGSQPPPALPSKPVKLSATSYGGTTVTALQGYNNTSLGWLAGWLLIANIGPDIAKLLQTAIDESGAAIKNQILPGVAAGLSPFEGGILGFLGQLGQAHTWIRVGEVVLGLILIAVGVAELTHAVPIATKIAKVVK